MDEVAFGQQIEMRRDLVRADAGDLLGDEFLIDHLLFLTVTKVEGGAQLQALQGSTEKIGVKGVLVIVPEAGRRAARVAERVHVKVAKPLGVAHQLGKSGGSLGIIYVPLLPKA